MESPQASTKNLDQALLKAQADCAKVVKDQENPFHKSRYASLESVKAAADPSLETNGLCFSSWPGTDGLVCRLSHVKSGEYREWTSPYFMDKKTPQALGSCVTYLRRYNLVSVLNLVAEDDDGNQASGLSHAKKQDPKREAPPPKRTEPTVYKATPAQKEVLASVFDHYKVTDLEIKKQINKALINWKVKATPPEMDKVVGAALESIANGDELKEVPFT